jgi:hypothetical protein
MPETDAGPEARPSVAGLTPAQRQALARSLQAKALEDTDPLRGNLTAITGDLALLAHELNTLLQAGLASDRVTAGGRQRFTSDCELYLKLVRQVDRLAQLQSGRPRPPATRVEPARPATARRAAAKCPDDTRRLVAEMHCSSGGRSGAGHRQAELERPSCQPARRPLRRRGRLVRGSHPRPRTVCGCCVRSPLRAATTGLGPYDGRPGGWRHGEGVAVRVATTAPT